VWRSPSAAASCARTNGNILARSSICQRAHGGAVARGLRDRRARGLDNFGRIEGTVAHSFEGGFGVQITASLYKRERIANLLTWLTNQESLGLTEEAA
jgi:hypothetical protein